MNTFLQELNIKFKNEKIFENYKEGKWVDAFPGESEVYWIKEVSEGEQQEFLDGLFDFLGSLKFWFMKIPAKGKIRWHIDHNREASLIFPLDKCHSIQFSNGYFRYDYFYNQSAIILNVKNKHRVINNSNSDRYALYGSVFDYSYDECIEMLNEQGLLLYGK